MTIYGIYLQIEDTDAPNPGDTPVRVISLGEQDELHVAEAIFEKAQRALNDADIPNVELDGDR